MLALFMALAATALIVLGVNIYAAQTVLAPKTGGVYREGLVGGPHYLNPALAPINEVDRDISRLIYRGLMKLDESGEAMPDLAAAVTLSEDKKTYDLTLRPGLFWQDGEPLTADDVVFTIQTIQNPNYQSPLKANWEGVTAEKTDAAAVRFTLVTPYAPFLENLTIGLLPQHIWQNVPADAFALTEFNLKPIGNGPYKVDKIEKTAAGAIRTLTLVANEHFNDRPPYIPTIIFKFFPDDATLTAAYEDGGIDGINFVPAERRPDFIDLPGLKLYQIPLPRYFGVFFNTVEPPLSHLKFREALAFAINREAIINEVLNGEAEISQTPIPPGAMFATTANVPLRSYDPEKAKGIIAALKLKDAPAVTITTLNDPTLTAVAERIQADWTAAGVTATVAALDPLALKQQAIRERQYQILLFGQALRRNPDPFSFWHSSQVKDPGLNIAAYKNVQVDKLLTEARQSASAEERRVKYAEFQALVVSDAPAIFLYSPYYLYGVRSTVKGLKTENFSAPEDRFNNVTDWYIKTRRVLK